MEASQIANSSDLKKKKSTHQTLFLDIGYCLLSQVIIGGGGALSHTGKLQHIMCYTIKREKKISDTEIKGFQNVLMSMFPLSSVLVHFVGRMIHSFQIWQLKQQQI